MRSSVARSGVLAEPGDDLVDDRRAFGLVVELVAESRVGPPLDVGSAPGSPMPAAGTSPSSGPCRTSVGRSGPQARRAGRGPARLSASAPNRAVLVFAQRVGDRPSPPPTGRATRSAVDAVGDRQRRRDATEDAQRATSSSRRASSPDPVTRGREVRPRAVGQQVAGDDQAAERVAVQRRPAGRPALGSHGAPAAPARSSW